MFQFPFEPTSLDLSNSSLHLPPKIAKYSSPLKSATVPTCLPQTSPDHEADLVIDDEIDVDVDKMMTEWIQSRLEQATTRMRNKSITVSAPLQQVMTSTSYDRPSQSLESISNYFRDISSELSNLQRHAQMLHYQTTSN